MRLLWIARFPNEAIDRQGIRCLVHQKYFRTKRRFYGRKVRYLDPTGTVEVARMLSPVYHRTAPSITSLIALKLQKPTLLLTQ